MKATGFVQMMNSAGHLLLPFRLRREMGIKEHDYIEIFTYGEYIILRKCEPACFFCGGAVDVKEFRGKSICAECAAAVVGVKVDSTE